MHHTAGDAQIRHRHTSGTRVLTSTISFEPISDVEQRSRMIETIAMLDGAASAMSAANLSDADLAELLRLHRRIDRMVETPAGTPNTALVHACDLLHNALVARCPNRRLRELVDEELTLLHAVDVDAARGRDHWRAVVSDHHELLELARDRADSAAFTKALRTHRMICH